MKLWMVVNDYLRTEKFKELERLFISACEINGLEFEIITNATSLITCSTSGPFFHAIPNNNDPILFWDKDLFLAQLLESQGHRLYNTCRSIQLCDDKRFSALEIAKYHLPCPKTLLAPMTYSNIGYTKLNFVDHIINELGLPLVVKEAFGSFGEQVYLCNSKDDLIELISNQNSDKLLFQEYIHASHGKDIRIQVVGDTVVAAMYRYSQSDDFRANISNGGQMRPYTPTSEEASLAIKVTSLLGLDFAGVDLLFGPKGPLICEINSNAHFKNIDECTGSNVANSIIHHIINTQKRTYE